MKKQKMLHAMSLVNEQFVAEADPTKGKKKRKSNWGVIGALGAIAACVCIAFTAVNLWLFLPFSTTPPDLSAYKDSEYYSVIEKLNTVTYQQPMYENRFEQYFSAIFGGFGLKSEAPLTDGVYSDMDIVYTDDVVMPNAGGSNYGSNMEPSYEEVTDNQVEGVTESDRIKRSNQYIYYLYNDILRVYSIEGENSKEVGSYDLVTDGQGYVNTSDWEFYLSEDCNTVTVVAEQYADGYVTVYSLDVSDPSNITEKNKVTVTGTVLSSRIADGKLLLLTNFYVKSNPDFSKEEEFLPQITTASGVENVPAENIFYPEKLDSSRYTAVYKMDEQTLTLEDSAAFLSYSENVYVSEDTVYATRTIFENDGLGSKTEIAGMSYVGEKLEYQGAIKVAGYLKDQYSMDEYEEILRVVTTTDGYRGTSASLYCVDLANWQVMATVEQFAPLGETVRSVRFDKEAAYVCTAVEQTDPVFFFDLSDLDNITYKDTGTISGFSTSLIQLGNGYLLGIGEDGSGLNVKLEVYEETVGGVASVCQYVIEDASYSTEYKSYYINREEQLIGLPFEVYPYHSTYSGDELERYLLVSFDGDSLDSVVNEPLAGENAYKRAVYTDGYFYMFGDGAFLVKNVG